MLVSELLNERHYASIIMALGRSGSCGLMTSEIVTHSENVNRARYRALRTLIDTGLVYREPLNRYSNSHNTQIHTLTRKGRAIFEVLRIMDSEVLI